MNLSAILITAAVLPPAIFAVIACVTLRRRGFVASAAVFVVGGTLTFLIGVLFGRFCGPVSAALIEGRDSTLWAAAADALFDAAVPEEAARLTALLICCACFRCSHKPAVAVQFGALMGLGFGAVENVFYSFTAPGVSHCLFRMIPTLSHAFDGVIMGGLLLWPSARKPGALVRVLLAFLIPTALHFAFDFGQFSAEVLGPGIERMDVDSPSGSDAAFLVGALLLMMLPIVIWIGEAIAATLIVRNVRQTTSMRPEPAA